MAHEREKENKELWEKLESSVPDDIFLVLFFYRLIILRHFVRKRISLKKNPSNVKKKNI